MFWGAAGFISRSQISHCPECAHLCTDRGCHGEATRGRVPKVHPGRSTPVRDLWSPRRERGEDTSKARSCGDLGGASGFINWGCSQALPCSGLLLRDLAKPHPSWVPRRGGARTEPHFRVSVCLPPPRLQPGIKLAELTGAKQGGISAVQRHLHLCLCHPGWGWGWGSGPLLQWVLMRGPGTGGRHFSSLTLWGVSVWCPELTSISLGTGMTPLFPHTAVLCGGGLSTPHEVKLELPPSASCLSS